MTDMPLSQQQTDERYMRRCIQLALNGQHLAKPNPMVGAVIVSDDGRIIGEGYHVRCGEGHAEVNAFASVRPVDEALLPQATIYVSLEPCSHYGKTPPCADLIIRKGVRRVVCGCVDPFAKVQGRGIRKIREAGIEVTVGVLEAECKALNRRFFTFNTLHRPYVILKWAQTANHKMALPDAPLAVSSPFTQMLSHKLRTENDAILVGRRTWDIDHPQLNVRRWSGDDPERLLLSAHMKEAPDGFALFSSIDEVMTYLYEEGKQSLIVEGGSQTHQAFIAAGCWDELRIETAPWSLDQGINAPALPEGAHLTSRNVYDDHVIAVYSNPATC